MSGLSIFPQFHSVATTQRWKVAQSMDSEKDEFSALFDDIVKWIEQITAYPGFTEWKRASIAETLRHGDGLEPDDQPLPSFEFPEEIVAQHRLVTSFLSLQSTWQAMVHTEYYFRRFPFKGLPISRHDHLRYTCENFFGRVYEFQERLRVCLNAFLAVSDRKIDVGRIIKKFKKDFQNELKERNQIHHHDHYDDVEISNVRLTELMTIGDAARGNVWQTQHRIVYRRTTRDWVKRSRNRAQAMKSYLDLVSALIRRDCDFLRQIPALNRPAIADHQQAL